MAKITRRNFIKTTGAASAVGLVGFPQISAAMKHGGGKKVVVVGGGIGGATCARYIKMADSGIDVTLICDNMAATLMAQGRIDLAIVGTDRVTANGDVVNKIGTLNVAVLCRHFGIPFYVACPSSTFDRHTASGAEVTIEERLADEVRQQHAAQVNVYNPAFDVTPAELVTGIITEHGIARHADELQALLG